MRPLLILGLLVLPACTDPSFGLNLSTNGSGVSVTPSASGRVGGLGVTVSP
jgi:hypothetical protein